MTTGRGKEVISPQKLNIVYTVIMPQYYQTKCEKSECIYYLLFSSIIWQQYYFSLMSAVSQYLNLAVYTLLSII